MKSNEYKLKTTGDLEIQVYEWLPGDSNKIIGVIQLAHGMAEHAKRYSHFAEFLTENGFAVYANDHQGHGKTAGKVENIGFFAKKNGWDLVISDMKLLSVHIRKEHPKLPFYILGHSMGSFLVRKYILKPEFRLNGVILSGTAGNPGVLGKIGVSITNLLMLFYPWNSPSKLMDKLTFGSYNKAFKPNRTSSDWLSSDNEQVDKYINDEYCGIVSSLGLVKDLVSGLLFVNRQKIINQLPEDLPILLFSGEKDPVGDNGKGIKEVYEKFKKAGIKNVSMKLFENGRHEILNEINRLEVYNFVLSWLQKNLV